jgi:F0F1-type ATP synthase delta subunit
MDIIGIELDLVDANRRIALLQNELDQLNKLADFHNATINTIHRDLHDAAKLIGDIHVAGKLTADHKKRLKEHVEKHGHPQDVPESEPQE